MLEVIADIQQLTPDRLTEILRAEGYLARGAVNDVEIGTTGETLTARYAHLRVIFADGSTPCPSAFLFLKYTKSDVDTERQGLHNQAEARFFQAMSGKLNLPVVPCYHIAHSKDWNQAHFLMADMSPTHWQVTELADPSADHVLEGRVDTLAKLHTYWWEHPQLGQNIGTAWTVDVLEKQRERVVERLSRFQTFAGNKLSNKRLEVLQRLLTVSSWDRLNSTLVTGQNVTLTHGDPHGANFLYPKDSDIHDYILIDWQAYELGFGGYELAHVFGLAFATGLRREKENGFLDRYYNMLQEGISYSWEELMYHYRLGIALCPLIVLAYWNNGMDVQKVWRFMDRAFVAYEDWDCGELF